LRRDTDILPETGEQVRLLIEVLRADLREGITDIVNASENTFLAIDSAADDWHRRLEQIVGGMQEVNRRRNTARS
jgi:hypothetical protein